MFFRLLFRLQIRQHAQSNVRIENKLGEKSHKNTNLGFKYLKIVSTKNRTESEKNNWNDKLEKHHNFFLNLNAAHQFHCFSVSLNHNEN